MNETTIPYDLLTKPYDQKIGKSLRAVIYVRISKYLDNGYGVSESIENQIKILTIIADRNGWTIVKIYKDEDISRS